MKKTNKVKMGLLGTPLKNPLGYFNSLKGKTNVEPKQTFKFGGLRKKECGGDTGIPCPEETAGKPLGANVGVGNFNAGYQGNVNSNALTNNTINAGYNNTNTGLGVKSAYDFNTKTLNTGASYNKNGFGIEAGYNTGTGPNAAINYTNNVGGKNKVPVKVGFTYNQKKGGFIKKKGGTTKATKFAALAPPYNKATAADRITGAKKNASKKNKK